MIATRRSPTLLALCCLTALACARGRQAEKLDRETAQTLLRESADAAGRGPTWSVDLLVFGSDPADQARLAFLKSLEPAVVKLGSTKTVDEPGFSAIPWNKPKQVQRFEFEAADPKTVASVLPLDTMKVAHFKIAVPTYKEVTGIVQEGTQAVATVVVSYAPNDTYRAIATALAAGASHPGFKPATLPSEADLAQAVTRTFAFRRYDDGWRVQGHRLLSRIGLRPPSHLFSQLWQPSSSLPPEGQRVAPG
jgi:hypothetical protein